MAILRCASPGEHSAVTLGSISTWDAAAWPGPPFSVFGTKQVLWTLGPAGSPWPPFPETPTEKSPPHPGEWAGAVTL